jgi:amino acid permease
MDDTTLNSGSFIPRYARQASEISIRHSLSSISSTVSPFGLSEGSIYSSSILVFASIIGVSFLYLPYSLYLSGIYLGILYIILSMLFNLFSCYCLISVAEKTHRITYHGIGTLLLGKRAGPVCEMALVISCFDKYLSYLFTLEYLPISALHIAGIENEFFAHRLVWLISITCLIIFPIAFLKNISSLRYFSLLTFLSSIFVTLGIFFEFLTMRHNLPERISQALSYYPYKNADYAHSLYPFSRTLMSFCCQTNLLAIYDEISYRTPKKGLIVAGIGLGSVHILCIILAVSGLLLFLQEGIQNQILLEDFNQGDPVMVIVRYTVDLYSRTDGDTGEDSYEATSL